MRLVATKENRMKILALASAGDVQTPDIAKKLGISYWSANRAVATLVKTGDLEVAITGKRGFAYRYTAAPTRQERAEEYIYRLIDKLMSHTLDKYELALCHEAGAFIKLRADVVEETTANVEGKGLRRESDRSKKPRRFRSPS